MVLETMGHIQCCWKRKNVESMQQNEILENTNFVSISVEKYCTVHTKLKSTEKLEKVFSSFGTKKSTLVTYEIAKKKIFKINLQLYQSDSLSLVVSTSSLLFCVILDVSSSDKFRVSLEKGFFFLDFLSYTA